MAFVDKRTQLANNQQLATSVVTSDSVDLGVTPALRGQAVSGCYLVITFTSPVSTAGGASSRVQIELSSSEQTAGQGAKYVHWTTGNLDFGISPASPTSSTVLASYLTTGRMFVVPLPHKATYYRYLQVLLAVDALSDDAFESGAFSAYITTVPPYSSDDLMPDGFNAVV